MTAIRIHQWGRCKKILCRYVRFPDGEQPITSPVGLEAKAAPLSAAQELPEPQPGGLFQYGLCQPHLDKGPESLTRRVAKECKRGQRRLRLDHKQKSRVYGNCRSEKLYVLIFNF